MAAETTTTAATAASAAAAAPLLAGLGIDLTTVGAALVGVVVVQTLLPSSEIKLRVVAGITVGSMLFSSLATPWLLLWALANVPYMAQLREWHAHALVASFAGAFAQPLLLLVRAAIGRWVPGAAAVPGPRQQQGDPP